MMQWIKNGTDAIGTGSVAVAGAAVVNACKTLARKK